MKKYLYIVIGLALSLTISAYAQPAPRGRGGMGMGGGGPGGMQISEAMAKLFGNNSAFTATMENQIKPSSQDDAITMPGALAFDSGKSRFEINLADAKGMPMPPQALDQMKAMGMDKSVIISRPDKKVVYMIYPGLKSYAEVSLQESDSGKSANFKTDTTDLGKETVDGRSCAKKKIVVTDDKDQKHEFTVWNASDLKDFPVKIQTEEQGNNVTMTFKDVKLAKPEASQFEPPAGFKKYTDLMEMMQQEMMKRMPGPGAGGPPGGMGGPPPGQ